MTALWIQLKSFAHSTLLFFWPLEVMAPTLGGLVGLTVAVLIHQYQRRNARVLPYLPSYLDQVPQRDHSDAMRFFAAVHDLTMCVTEAWNMTQAQRTKGGSVERNLSQAHLQQACEGVQTHGERMMQELADYAELSNLMGIAEAQLGEAWEYTSRDNYRTEYTTETSTDQDGNTTTETKSRQVYENTDHWFTFKSSQAHMAQSTLGELGAQRARARLVPPQLQRMRVSLDNLSQTDRMFLEKLYVQTIVEDPEASPTETELRTAVNQWLLGTRIDRELAGVEEHMDRGLHTRDDEFATIHASSPTYHFLTTSRRHSGPAGYQAAERLRKVLSKSTEHWGQVAQMWDTCSEAAGTLLKWALDDSELESDRQYARSAIGAYEAAFPDSTLEVDQLTTPGWTVFIGVAVAVFVGLAVVAAHPNSPWF